MRNSDQPYFWRWLLCLLSNGLLISAAFATNAVFSPIGHWQTIDDVTQKPKAVINLWIDANHHLYGRILSFNPSPGKDEHEVCTACQGSQHNQPILGMVILEKLEQSTDNPNQWRNGYILDPHNGNTYRVTLDVVNQGQALRLRGYIGMPLFGRTQTWTRIATGRSQ